MSDNVPRITVSDVLDNELRQIQSGRIERLETIENTRDPANSLIGLAFSGGGIRSAAIPSRRKRERQRAAVRGTIESRRAIFRSCVPLAASKTILAQSTTRAGILRPRA